MILDSNLIIYSAKPEYPHLREFIAKHSPAVSAVSVVEVLGFHRITPSDKQFFEQFFQAAQVLPLHNGVIVEAVKLRQSKKMSLGDSLIAATAIVFQKVLQTNNTVDFEGISQLKIANPLLAIRGK
jgi:predicted nucleic acid-binding protein